MGTATYPRLVAKSQSFARVASLAVVLSGCLVLLGWIYDITAFKSVLPGLVTIKVNAALCFILAGIALRLVAGKGGKVRTWIARACALTVAGFGLATLSQDLFGWNLGIDQLLFTEPVGPGNTPYPGRMAPTASLSFLLVGLALLFLNTKPGRDYPLSQFLVLPAAFIVVLVLIGYAYNIPKLYVIPGFTSMAVHAAATFALLCAGIIAARAEGGLMALLLGGGSIEQKIVGGFGLAGAILIGIIMLSYQSTFLFQKTNREVAHSQEVLKELEATLSLMKDALIGQHRYVITEDERQLELFNTAIRRMPDQLKRVRNLTADNPTQQRRLDIIEPLIATNLAFRTETIKLQKTKGAAAVIQSIKAGLGKQQTEEIRKVIADMEQQERDLLAQRNAEAEQSTRFMIVVIIIGSLAALTLIVLTSVLIRRAISEQMRADKALRESEAQFRTVLDHSPAMFFLKDLQGRYLLCNREFEKITHAPQNAVIGKTDDDLFAPQQAASFRANDRKVIETGATLAFEEIALHDDGPHTSIAYKFPLRDEAGTMYAVGGLVTDITQRKRTEETIRALFRITDKLNATLEMQTLLDELIREAMELANAEGGCAGLRTPQGLVTHKYFHGPDILPLEYCWPPGHGLPGWVLNHKIPYLTNDAGTDQQIAHALWDKFGVRSALSIPILDSEREVLGFLQLHNKRGRSGFTPADQTTLMLVAQSAVNAIQRALVFQRVQQTEKTLRENEERFRSLMESATDAIVLADQRGHILSVNQAALRFFGYKAEEVLGKPLTILMPVRYRAAHQQGLERLRTTGQSRVVGRTVELHGLRKDGSEFPLALSLGTWKAKGEIFFGGIMRDLTAQKKAQRLEGSFRALVESVKDYAIFMLTPQGLVDSWNVGAERIKGYSTDEALGQHLSRFYPPEDIQAGKPEMVLKMAAAEGRCEETGWRVRKDGSKFLAHAIVTAIRDETGQLRGFSKVTQDITDQRKTQQALEYSFEQLRALARRLEDAREDERTRIAREIHDELGGTLSYLKLDLTKLSEMVPSATDKEVGSALRERISSITQILDKTIGTVRQIATALRPGVLDDFGLVAAIEWLARDFQKRSGITCTFHPAAEDLPVEKESATALFRICQEALTNVVRHAQADRVTIRLAKIANQLLLEIRDNGQGIPEAKIARSMSLGLVGMRERATQLGGEFQIGGFPGKGTTITARVPLSVPKAEEGTIARDLRESSKNRTPGEQIG